MTTTSHIIIPAHNYTHILTPRMPSVKMSVKKFDSLFFNFQEEPEVTPVLRKRPQIAPELDTVLKITIFMNNTYYKKFWEDQRALDATSDENKEQWGSGWNKKYCDAQVAQLRRQQEINRIHINLLQQHIINNRVKGQMLIAKRTIKELNKENYSHGLSCQPWYNGGIW